MTSESKKEKLNKNELLANYQYLMDTIWTIYLEDGSVDIHYRGRLCQWVYHEVTGREHAGRVQLAR